MPLVDYGDDMPSLGNAQLIDVNASAAVPTTDPDLMSTMGAAFREGNMLGSAFASETFGLNRYGREDGFDPIKEVTGTKYEARIDDAADIFNRPYFEAWKRQIDREEGDRRTLEASGWMGTGAAAVAGILDLPTLIPGGTLVRGARGGYSALRSGASVAAAGGFGAALSETGLQATQQTRTASETAVSIGAGVVFGGLLGAGVGGLMSRVEQKAATSAIDRTLQATRQAEAGGPSVTPELDEMEAIFRGEGDMSIGAAQTDMDTLDDLSIKGRAAALVGKTTAWMNPILRAYQSPSARMRDVMLNGLVDNPVYMAKNMAGRGSQSAETFIQTWENGALGTALREYRDVYKQARAAGLPMTKDQFTLAVGRSMRRGDQGENEFVTQAAKVYRERVFDPLKNEAIALGLLPKDVDTATAMSYLHRVYRRDKIVAQEPQFREAIRPHIEHAVDQAISIDAKKLDKQAENLQREIESYETGILRRRSSFEERQAGGEIGLEDGVTEADVLSMIRQVRTEGRPKPPQSLMSYLSSKGLYDPGGDLASIGINNRTRPGFIRRVRSTSWGEKKGGGMSLDDAAQAAWDEGFFPGWTERPTVREFLQAVDDDFRGTRRVVREGDADAAAAASRIADVEAALTRMGVDLANPKFATSEATRDFAAKVSQALDDIDRTRVAGLREKQARVTGDRDQTANPFVSPEDRQDYIEGILTDVIRRVTGQTGEDVPYGLVSKVQGPLKERVLKVPDEIIEDYLEDDIELVARRYVRKMAADVELTRRFGSADLKDQEIEIRGEYDELKAAATTEAERAQLTKREARDIADMQAVRDMLRGQFDPRGNSTDFARILNGAQSFNFLRTMGGVTLGSLTDVVRPAMVNGIRAYVQDAIVPMITNLQGIKLSAKDAKLAGAISEVVMQSRIAQMAELADPYGSNSPFERFLSNMAQRFGVMTGLAHWTDFQNTIASVLTQTRLLRNVEQGWPALAAKERAWMSFVGVDEAKWSRVAEQVKRYGFDEDGVPVANTEAWTDQTAKRIFYAAVLKDVRSTIVAKGVADVPVFAHKPIGRALLQFKTFSLASNQRVLMRGLQEDKSNLVGGIVAMTAMGAFTYWLKQMEAGRDVSSNPGTWIAEGLDRSGIFALGFEVNNAFEKAGAPGVYSLMSMAGQQVSPGADARQPASRFATRGVVDGFLGPTFGLAADTVAAGSIPLRGASAALGGQPADVTPSDVATLRRLAPFASLPYWRWLIDGGFGFDYGAVPALKEAVR